MTRADPEAFAGTARFVVERRLGAGSFGVVYEVLDGERHARVALKTLRADAARALYRFKQEFRALADVSHPNLVALYELLSDGDQWFFTMEKVEGVPFLDYVRGTGSTADDLSSPTGSELERLLRSDLSEDGGPGPLATGEGVPPVRSATSTAESQAAGVRLERLRPALRQLAEGVSALHAAGKLHRDIKPSNVLVTREGRVVLLDFGLVRELSASALTHTLDSAGTPAYMSPEQAAEQPLTTASDWYSVGVMLYESLTGVLPFSGRPLEVIRRKQIEDALPPSAVAAMVPEDLDALSRELLRRDPAGRPSGAEVLRRLAGAPAHPSSLASAQAAPPYVGRRGALAVLREAYTLTRLGRAATVGVHGGSGSGKTALVRRFIEGIRAEDPDVVVLAGRCHERETVPYKALDGVVDSLSHYLRRLPRPEVEALLPHDVLALARLFPVLRQVPGVSGARRSVLQIPDSLELRRRAFGALRELMVRIADRHPIVLFIDDLHWGDVDSATLLTDIMKPPDSPALLLVGSYRTEEAATSTLLAIVLPLRDSPDATGLEKRDIEVAELTLEESREMAVALVGTHPDARESAEAIAREGQGNPVLIDALARFAADEPSPGRLDEVIRRRAAALAPPARRLLDVVAVASGPVELTVATHAAEVEGQEDVALATLRADHFVRTRRTRDRNEVEPYHDRVRDAVLAGIPADELRRLHERLAEAVLALGRADPERLAHHYREAGQADTAAEYAASAGDAAANALAFDRAARLYRMSVELRPPDAPARRALRIKLADALANGGRPREAADAYLAAVPGSGAAERIDLHRRASEQLLVGGHIEEGTRLLHTVLSSVGLSMPRGSREAMAWLVVRRALLRVRGLGFRRRDENRVPGWELLRIDTCWSVAVGFGFIDIVRAAEFQARNLRLALRAGEPYRVARALALEATYTVLGGVRSRGRVDRLVRTANTLASQLGNHHALGLARMAEGVTAWVQGKWRTSLGLCDEAAIIFRERCTGAVWETHNVEMFAVAALVLLGDLREMSKRLAELIARAEERGNLLVASNMRGGFLTHMSWLAADDPDGAQRELEVGSQASAPAKFDFRHIWLRGALRDIGLYRGDVLAGMDGVDDRWRPAARLLHRFTQAGLILGAFSQARRRVALAAADPGHAPEHIDRAEAHARAIEGERTEWGGALALVIRAGTASVRGRKDRALVMAAEAEARLQSADMALHAAAVRRQRGALLGGDAGRTLVAEADAWMSRQSIRRPDRMAAMLAPGRWTAGPD